ncbi:immunity protein [Klebsiella pneumoniae]|uniref:immunity protein n=1 Tax=Enterobacteriaceae TaxID=543 RepID=UPI0020CC69D4|nr:MULTISPECIES: immunity protein [Enterobacteriaceae]MCQ0556580.1 immunity protein [Klebsiella pneumoniae]MDA4308526.1 immunity protein [Escherichia coli]MDA4425807.1 immunity protein [Escherichia coli]MDA4437562.1 immunity protein [Escherichia coli]
MLDLEGIYKNESVEDVLLFFAPRTAYPTIDRMYVQYRFEIVEKALLYPAYAKLLKEGKLAEDEKGHTLKGPNWKKPKFVTEKKYGIE